MYLYIYTCIYIIFDLLIRIDWIENWNGSNCFFKKGVSLFLAFIFSMKSDFYLFEILDIKLVETISMAYYLGWLNTKIANYMLDYACQSIPYKFVGVWSCNELPHIWCWHWYLFAGELAVDDVFPTGGTLYFVSNDVTRTFTLNILPDDVPEEREVKIYIHRTSKDTRGWRWLESQKKSHKQHCGSWQGVEYLLIEDFLKRLLW